MAFSSNKFDKATPKSNTFGKINISNSYSILERSGGSGIIDILNKFKWKNWGSAGEVPAVYAEERSLSYGVFTNSILNLIEQGKNVLTNEGLDIYSKLYESEPTGFNYVFPYLLGDGSNIRTINNQWSQVGSGITEMVNGMSGTSKNDEKNPFFANLVSAGINFAAGSVSPGWGMEELFQFQNTARQSLPISFPLYNTGDIEDIYSNLSFINLFSYQNLKNRTSMMTYLPPKIYVVDAKALGGIYMPVAYVSDFKVDSIGTTRRMSELKKYGISNALIPEAYKVSITFTELLPQSANIFLGALGGKKVNVVSISDSNDSNNNNSSAPPSVQVPNTTPSRSTIIINASTTTETFSDAPPQTFQSIQ